MVNEVFVLVCRQMAMTPIQKVAAILIGLGQETAARIMKHLHPEEVEAITKAIASMQAVSQEQIAEALAEFEALFRAGQRADAGGPEFAREALEKAVGPKRAQQIMARVESAVSQRGLIPKGIPPDRIAALINKEHPQVIALLLACMEPDTAAGVLNALPVEIRDDVAYRIATLDDVAPDALKDLQKNLSAEVRKLIAGEGVEVKGTDRAAAILNRAGSSLEQSVLTKLAERDPDLADQLRQKMFSFEDLADLSDRDLQKLLQNAGRKELTLAMKMASDRLKERVLANLSKRVAAGLQEDIQLLGPRRKSEVEEAQRHILDLARDLDAAGEIALSRGDEEKI
jgi:flagellar motor switch protein FliG